MRLSDYDIDGIVFKIDDLQLKRLGNTSKTQMGTAYKFSSEKATSIIKDIVIQVAEQVHNSC